MLQFEANFETIALLKPVYAVTNTAKNQNVDRTCLICQYYGIQTPGRWFSQTMLF